MINIDRVYRRVNEDLIQKGKGGYTSGDQFNRDLVDAQNYLFQFYIVKEKETRKVLDALSPFVVETTIPIVSGYATLPSDYGHKRDVIVQVQDTTCTGNTVVYDDYECSEMKSGEYSKLLQSPIRKPSLTNYYYKVVNDQLKIYPATAVGQVALEYYKNPPAAVWGFTLDVANDQENYDAGTSTDLVWREQEANSLINVLLYLKGVNIRDNEVVNWLAANQIVEAQ